MRKLTNIFFILSLMITGAMSTEAFARSKFDDGLERWVDIVNLSETPIYSVQISDVDDPNWDGPNLLDDWIDSYDAARVDPPRPMGYCRFDALVTYEDGTEVKVWNVNLCDASEIAVEANGHSYVS